MTQQQLGDAIGADRTYINKIENGKSGLPLYETRKKLGDVLGFTDDDLRGDILDSGGDVYGQTDLVRISPSLANALMELSEEELPTGVRRVDYAQMEPVARVTRAFGLLSPLQRDLVARALESLTRASWHKLLDLLVAAGEVTEDEAKAAGKEVVQRDPFPERERLLNRIRALKWETGVETTLEVTVRVLEELEREKGRS
jgi:transcriptional regulator with XRE-family HTH domain